MIREANRGVPPHWDDVVREYPEDFLESRPVAQLAFNVYLSMPEQGGETLVWRRRWCPADEEHRVGFAYGPGIALEDEPLVLRSEIGDALLFDPRNYHAVRPAIGEGRRMALAFFLGLGADGGLTAWS
jgi:hypothetical protein